MENKVTKKILTISLILQLIFGITSFTINIVFISLAKKGYFDGQNYDSVRGISSFVLIFYILTIVLAIFNIIYYIILRIKKVLLKEDKRPFWGVVSVNTILFCYFWIHIAYMLIVYASENGLS